MNKKNTAIAVLSVTSVMLFCTLVLVNYPSASRESIAWADTVDRGGDYVLATGSFSGTNEALYVLDGSVDRLSVYKYDKKRRAVVLYDEQDLREFFGGR